MPERIKYFCAGALFVSLAIPASAPAQTLPSFATVATFQVKSGMRLEFEALQQKANAAREEAGITARFAYRVVRGGSANEYLFFTPLDSLADYDQPLPVRRGMGEAAAAEWFAQLNGTVEDVQLDTLRIRADLSIPRTGERAPRLARVRTVDVRPGRGQDYQQWITNNWVPAMKDAGMSGVIHFQNAFGVGQRKWTRMTLYDSWADLDGHPVQRHLEPGAFSAVLGNNGEMTLGPEVRILEFLPNVSILANTP